MSRSRTGSAVASFFGAALMAVGGLMTALCGLCTTFFVMDSLFGRRGEFSGPDMLVLILPIGGVPTAIGLGMFFLGRRLYRSAQPPGGAPP